MLFFKKPFCFVAYFQVKKILFEEEEGSSDSSHPNSASSEDEDIFEETAQVLFEQDEMEFVEPQMD